VSNMPTEGARHLPLSRIDHTRWSTQR
jgi:hypothetical protein